MTTESERIEKLEQLVDAMLSTTPAVATPSLESTFNVVHVTAEQSRAIQQLLKSWVPEGTTEGGEFDPMDYLAANRGWNPLELEEFMEVGIGDKRYKIHRVR